MRVRAKTTFYSNEHKIKKGALGLLIGDVHDVLGMRNMYKVMWDEWPKEVQYAFEKELELVDDPADVNAPSFGEPTTEETNVPFVGYVIHYEEIKK